jgi:hypothetical protein
MANEAVKLRQPMIRHWPRIPFEISLGLWWCFWLLVLLFLFSGAQIAYGYQDSDARLAFQRLAKALEQGGSSIKDVAVAGIYPLSTSLAAQARKIRFEFFDRSHPPASTLLDSLGIRWKNGFDAANLDPAPDIVVLGNALSRGNPEVEAVLDHKIPYRSLPQTLEEFFLPGHDSLVVTGTHGKTTTTSMLSWILHHAGRRPWKVWMIPFCQPRTDRVRTSSNPASTIRRMTVSTGSMSITLRHR